MSNLDFIENFDYSYVPIFFACWSDWEEDGWILICEKEKKIYYCEGGTSVMASGSFYKWIPEEISQDEALNLMIQWKEYEEPI